MGDIDYGSRNRNLGDVLGGWGRGRTALVISNGKSSVLTIT
jgi:hypothetical protein